MTFLESAYDFVVWWVLMPYGAICITLALVAVLLEKRK
jgi:hypothetical protein